MEEKDFEPQRSLKPSKSMHSVVSEADEEKTILGDLISDYDNVEMQPLDLKSFSRAMTSSKMSLEKLNEADDESKHRRSTSSRIQLTSTATRFFHPLVTEQKDKITSIVFSPDGKYIATGSVNSRVGLYDRNGRHLYWLDGHNEEVWSLMFNGETNIYRVPETNLLVSSGGDGKIFLWNVKDGIKVRSFDGHVAPVRRVIFSPDDSLIISGSEDHSIKVWDIFKNQLLWSFGTSQKSPIREMAISPGGTLLLTGRLDNTINIWKLPDSAYLNEVDEKNEENEKDGKEDNINEQKKKFDLPYEITTLDDHAYVVTSLAFSRNGTYFASGSQDGTANLWSARSAKTLHKWRIPKGVSTGYSYRWVTKVCFSPSGSQLCILYPGLILIVDVESYEIIHMLKKRVFFNSVRYTSQGDFIITGSASGGVHVFNAKLGLVVNSFSAKAYFHVDSKAKSTLLKDFVLPTAVFSNGNEMKVVAKFGRHAGVFDLSSDDSHLSYMISTTGEHDITRLNGYESSKYLFEATTERVMYVRNIENGCMLSRLEKHTDSIRFCSVSPNEKLVATVGDVSCCVWNIESGTLVTQFIWPKEEMQSVIWSPFGRFLAVRSSGAKIYVCSLEESKIIANFPVEKLGIQILEPMFFSDEEKIVWVISKKTVRKCDMKLNVSQSFPLPNDHHVRNWCFTTFKSRARQEGGHIYVVTKAVPSHIRNDEDEKAEIKIDGSNQELLNPKALYLWQVGNVSSAGDYRSSIIFLRKFVHDGKVSNANFSKYGDALVSYADCLYIWNVHSGKLMHKFPNATGITYFTVSPKLTYLACVQEHTLVRVYNLKQPVRQSLLLAAHDKPLIGYDCLTFSADEMKMFTYGKDGDLKCYLTSSFRLRPRVIDVWSLFNHPKSRSSSGALHDYIIFLLENYPGLVNETDSKGNTLLHLACMYRHDWIVELLLKYPSSGSSFNGFIVNKEGSTALDLCIEYRSTQCLEHLLNVVPNLPPRNMEEVMKIFPALCREHPEKLVKLLKDVGLRSMKPIHHIHIPYYIANNGIREGSESLDHNNLWKNVLEKDYQIDIDRKDNRRRGYNQKVDSDDEDIAIMETGVPVFEHVVPFPYLTKYYKKGEENPIKSMYKYGLADAFGTKIMKEVLLFKWEKYGKQMFYKEMIIFFLFLAMFCCVTIIENDNVDENDKISKNYNLGFAINGTLSILEYIVGVMSVIYLFREIKEFYFEGWRYLWEVWNYFDISGFTLAFASILLRKGKTKPEDYYSNIQKSVEAFASVILWLKVLSFARGFRSTGPFIRMIFRILFKVRFFVGVLIVVIVGFSHGFFLVYRTADVGLADDVDIIFDEWQGWGALSKVYTLMLGEADTEAINASSVPAVSWILFVAFTAGVTIVMLNLLIAFLSDIYSTVQVNVENEWMLERAELLLEAERNLTNSQKSNKSLFPKWLHVLITKTHDDEKVVRNQDLLNQLQSSNDDLQKKIKDINENQTQMFENLERLRLFMEQISGQLQGETSTSAEGLQ